MKKFLILFLITTLLVTGFFYEKNLDFFNFKSEKQIQTLVKNITSDSSISSDPIYNKGDELEYGIIVKPGNNKELTIKTDKIDEIIKIKEIKVDGEIISKEKIKDINFTKNSVITISGEAKIDSDNFQKSDEIITINTEKEIETIKEINEEIIKEEILDKKLNNLDIEKLNYSSNVSNLIKISGENLEQVEFVNIGEISFKPQYIEPYLYVLVEENKALSGEQFVFFQKKNGEIETYDKKINFNYSESSIVVVDITPKTLKNDINRNIILQGKGFSKVISIGLSNNIILKDTSFNVINDRVMSVVIPKGLAKGNYTLNIMDIEGIYKSNINITIN